MGQDETPVNGVIFDLDGTVYNGYEAVEGVADFINHLADRGIVVRYATNRASRPPEDIHKQLTDMGICCEVNEIMTTSLATAAILKPGRAYVIGREGLREALVNRNFTIVDQDADYVIVSMDRDFTYGMLATASQLILDGAKFFATNPDRGIILEGRLWPGSGTIVAAVETATNQKPQIIGKPQPLLFNWVLQEMGLEAPQVVAIGDNLETDIPAGQAAGMRTMLTLTGMARREDLADAKIAPTWVAEDYDEVSRILTPLLSQRVAD